MKTLQLTSAALSIMLLLSNSQVSSMVPMSPDEINGLGINGLDTITTNLPVLPPAAPFNQVSAPAVSNGWFKRAWNSLPSKETISMKAGIAKNKAQDTITNASSVVKTAVQNHPYIAGGIALAAVATPVVYYVASKMKTTNDALPTFEESQKQSLLKQLNQALDHDIKIVEAKGVAITNEDIHIQDVAVKLEAGLLKDKVENFIFSLSYFVNSVKTFEDVETSYIAVKLQLKAEQFPNLKSTVNLPKSPADLEKAGFVAAAVAAPAVVGAVAYKKGWFGKAFEYAKGINFKHALDKAEAVVSNAYISTQPVVAKAATSTINFANKYKGTAGKVVGATGLAALGYYGVTKATEFYNAKQFNKSIVHDSLVNPSEVQNSPVAQ